jgi:uncharacterized membrane protein (UPF0127 family)
MKTFFLCLFAFMALAACDNKAAAYADPLQRLSIVTKDGTRHDFKIELAVTPEEQAQGLMNRTEMAKDEGMLFFFNDFAERSFWMKNTLIPLDMIFMDEEGVIVNIHDSAIPNDLTSIKSGVPARAVLELNGGVANTLGIKAGDKVHHVFFGNDLD